MYFLEHFYRKTVKYDLINKFFYNKTKNFPKIKKIVLNFGCKTTEIRDLSSSLLALELITNKKGSLTFTKQPNIFLKIRKGHPVGCKVTLKKKQMFNFLEKILIEIFPKIKNFNGFLVNKKLKKNAFSYELHNTFAFNELEEHYYLFNKLPNLKVTIITQSKTKEELIFILKSLQFPIKNKSKYNSIGRV